jgi:hypothetical protein
MADTIVSQLDDIRDVTMGEILRGAIFRPNIPYRRGPYAPVLQPEQRIVNSCYEDGFFTIATTPEAADRMFGDTVPMWLLVQALSRTPPASPQQYREIETIRDGTIVEERVPVTQAMLDEIREQNTDLVIIRGKNMVPSVDVPEQVRRDAAKQLRPSYELSDRDVCARVGLARLAFRQIVARHVSQESDTMESLLCQLTALRDVEGGAGAGKRLLNECMNTPEMQSIGKMVSALPIDASTVAQSALRRALSVLDRAPYAVGCTNIVNRL